MDVFQSFLGLGFTSAIGLWNLETCDVLCNLSMTAKLPSDRYIKSINLTDCLLIAMTSSGRIRIWSIFDLCSKLNPSPILNIENTNPSWKNLTFSQNKLAFGLEMKLGDVKLYNLDTDPSHTGNKGLNKHSVGHQFSKYLNHCHSSAEMIPDLK